jgi:hypothetical protein
LLVHGWINGHKHNPELDADIADYYNFIRHMKENAGEDEIVIAVDSGDQTQVILFIIIIYLTRELV